MSSASSDRTQVFVTSPKDDGSVGTLRWAINETQNTEGDDEKFDIIFSPPENAPENELRTGYWTIGLKSVLPNIYKNDVRINHIDSRSVILHPIGYKKPSSDPTPLGAEFYPYKYKYGMYDDDYAKTDSDGTSSSMLVVGDTHLVHKYLNEGVLKDDRKRELPFKVSNTRPTLSIKNINFVSNHVKGGDGTRQAGGGGAMGGAILLVDGDLSIENSVFQNLRVDGGKATGHNPKSSSNATDKNSKPGWAEGGGASGYFSTPLYRWQDLVGTSWEVPNDTLPPLGFAGLSYPRDTFGGGYNGGAPGCVGKKHSNACGDLKNTNGRDGTPNAFMPLWGYGWSSGSAGGAAGLQDYAFSSTKFGRPGSGAKGGGNQTASHWREKIIAGGGGMGAPGNDGGDTRNRKNGEDGFGLGGAIAIIGDHPKLKEHAEPVLKLNKVDFYNVSASDADFATRNPDRKGKLGYADQNLFTYDEKHENIFVKDSYSASSQEAVKDKKLISDFQDLVLDEIDSPYFYGTSYSRNNEVARVRGDVIETRLGFKDVVIVDVEDINTNLSVKADLSDPSNPINRLFNEMIDFDEETTRNNYYASQSSGSGGLFSEKNFFKGAFALGGMVLNGACTYMASATPLGQIPMPIGATDIFVNGETESQSQTGTVASAVCGFASDQIMGAVKDEYYGSQQKEQSRVAYENSMEVHEKKRAKLNDTLSEMTDATVGTVDVKLERAPVVIEDFEIGRDILLFPYGLEKDNIRVRSSSNTDPNVRKIEVHLSYHNSNNVDLPFATLRLAEGAGELITTGELDAASYVQNLLSVANTEAFGGPVNVLTGMRQKPIIVSKKDGFLAQGPSSYSVSVNRVLEKIAENEDILIVTNQGDDRVEGSYGVELIRSGPGNDILFPVAGNDTVDGELGEDVVSYVQLFHPLSFKSQDDSGHVKVSGDYILYSLDENKPEEEEGKINSATLKNIEGFHAFGASAFDLSQLKQPDSVSLGLNDDGEPIESSYLYSVKTGSGSKVIGSDFSDVIEISYYQSFNQPTLSLDASSSILQESFDHLSKIEGGKGRDVLRIDLSDAEFDEIEMLPLDNGFELNLAYAGNKASSFVRAADVEVLNITFPDKGISDDSPLECVDGIECIIDLGALDGASGSDSGDLIRGESGSDVLKGFRGGDKLYGGSDADHLLGGKGQDLLIGGADSDFLNGGGGSDVMHGGAGSDTYKLSRGHDVVRGFEVGVDIIQAPDIPELSQQGRHVLLSYPGGTTLLRKTALDDVAVWLTPEAGGLELLA